MCDQADQQLLKAAEDGWGVGGYPLARRAATRLGGSSERVPRRALTLLEPDFVLDFQLGFADTIPTLDVQSHFGHIQQVCRVWGRGRAATEFLVLAQVLRLSTLHASMDRLHLLP